MAVEPLPPPPSKGVVDKFEDNNVGLVEASAEENDEDDDDEGGSFKLEFRVF
jgi:hypothetical protein